MQWYYSKSGAQLGPIGQDELIAKIASGEIQQSDMVWREGMSDWMPVSKVAELAQAAGQLRTTQPSVPVGGDVMNSPYVSPTAGSTVPSAYGGPVIPNYLWQSIVVAIFCCPPFGIPAIVYAAKVDGLVARGDIQGAMAASASAKNWCGIAVGSWIVVIVLWLLVVGMGTIFSQ